MMRIWAISAVIAYLNNVDPAMAGTARRRYACLTPWERDPAIYGQAVLSGSYRDCEEAVLSVLRDMLERRIEYSLRDRDRFFDAAQNARLVADAERYYRLMYYGSVDSWNLRDQHSSTLSSGCSISTAPAAKVSYGLTTLM